MVIKKSDIEAVRDSGLVDEEWYLEHYRDVAMLGFGAPEHYLRVGGRLMRNPGPSFDTKYYLASNKDVAASGRNALLHYVHYGRKEGRRCLPPKSKVGTAGMLSTRLRPEMRIQVRNMLGQKEVQPGKKTILVCAHIAGKQVFGSERSLLDVLDGFSEIGFNVVVTIPGGGGDYAALLRERSIEVISFKYRWWGKDLPVDENAVAEFARIIVEHGVDAVHVNTIMVREPLIAARRMAVPAIVHARELITYDEALCSRIGECPARIVERVKDSADWIIANSEATARCFDTARTTRIVPNTVDESLFDLAPPSPGPRVRIMLVSSNLPKKGIHDFVEVAALLIQRVPDAEFILVGPHNSHIDEFKQRQAVGDVPSNIRFGGYCDSPYEAMTQADIVLNLSHFQESFGRTVLEAMAAARPVVVYDWGALPELVLDGATGFVVPFRDVAAVADRIELLCADTARIGLMGAAARLRATSMYMKSRYVKQLEAAYEDIFSENDFEPKRIVLESRDRRAGVEEKEPLRIAYFLWHFPVPSETFVLNELRILVDKGHDVHVYCRQSPHKGFEPDFPIKWTVVASPEELAKHLAQTSRSIVHSHFTYPTVTDMVWPACEMAQVPFTFIAHAQDIFRHANDARNRIGEIGRSRLCKRVVVPSRFHREYVESRGVPTHKIFINPNGIDPGLYAADHDIDRAKRPTRSVCAIHRFTEKKGLENLIRAGKQLISDGIDIHLYGYGELESSYRELIHEVGAFNVHIHGAVADRAQMLEVFAKHDLFACPSVRAVDGDMDGIPTVLMEAMASGIPVVATAVSGIPDLVRDEVTGIVCEQGEEGLVNAIRRFYALPDSLVAAIIHDAATLIERDFNAVVLTSMLIRVWSERALDVMIVSWNNVEQLHEVVARLQKYTALPWHLIICDNGSDRPVLSYLCDVYATYDNVSILFNRDNVYVGPGTNLCLEHGRSDYAVYVCGKEGFVFDYGWEKPLVQYMDANPEVGQAGTLCYSPSYLTGSLYPTGIAEFPNFRNKNYALEQGDRRFAHVQGGFFVVRRAMYEEIGGFSQQVPHNYTDVEFSYYVESMGWKLGSAPGMLALFNKTRPGLFTRLDESISAMHPPTLEEIPLLERLVKRNVAYCNVCGWYGDAFEIISNHHVCPSCHAYPEDRSLYKFLAESTLTYRRLPAIGINVGSAMEDIWRKQFQGRIFNSEELSMELEQNGKLPFGDGTIRFILANNTLQSDSDEIVREIARVMATDGVLLVRADDSINGALNEETLRKRMNSYMDVSTIAAHRYSSVVMRYDSVPMFAIRCCEVDKCVS